MFDFNDGDGQVPAHRHRYGGGWVADTSSVSHTAYVGAYALVFGKAKVFGNVRISGKAKVSGDTVISGNAKVFGDAWVAGKAKVSGKAKISGKTEVYGNAWVYGDAWVAGKAKVFGDAVVSENARVSGDAEVYGDAKVYGDAWVVEQVYADAHVFEKGVLPMRPLDDLQADFEPGGAEYDAGEGLDVTLSNTVPPVSLPDMEDEFYGENVDDKVIDRFDVEADNKKMDRFDVEQNIMDCWHLVDDIKHLTEMVLDRDASTDDIANILIGMQTLYNDRFDKLMNSFEEVVVRGKI